MKLSKQTAYALHALMYMVRHLTQLPASSVSIAKAEGIPPRQLSRILKRLAEAGLVVVVQGRSKGYVFVRPPEQITLLELFEAIEGRPLFSECLLKHCQCGGTPENCGICSAWQVAVRDLEKAFSETSLVTISWQHPEHRCCGGTDLVCSASHPDRLLATTNESRFSQLKKMPRR